MILPCCSLTYLLTPWSRVLLEKLTGSAASQEIPGIFGTRKFLTVLTSARHLSLSWANTIQSPQSLPTSWKSILILSSHLRLGLPSGLLSSGFLTRTLCTPLLSPIRATCPAHLILLDFITRTILGKEYRSLRTSLCNFLHSPVTSSLLAPNTLLSTLFSNTLSLRSSLSVSDQVSHPYRKTDNIMVLYIFIFNFFDSKTSPHTHAVLFWVTSQPMCTQVWWSVGNWLCCNWWWADSWIESICGAVLQTSK